MVKGPRLANAMIGIRHDRMGNLKILYTRQQGRCHQQNNVYWCSRAHSDYLQAIFSPEFLFYLAALGWCWMRPVDNFIVGKTKQKPRRSISRVRQLDQQ